MLISKIIINKTRDRESIELNVNDNLISYPSNGGEPNPDGLEEVLLLILLLEES